MTYAARNSELELTRQAYGEDPLTDRETDLYRGEYIMSFVEKWDELIDWSARAESEGQFFIDILRARGKQSVLDVATGTGFHSVRLTEAGFDVTSADGSAAMLSKAFGNGQARGLILKTVKADWRWLNRNIHGKYDAIICLGNSFTHLHGEFDRRRALAEFYAALRHDGILILDQRNYDTILDEGFRTKHKYYYCGNRVVAQPSHIDKSLVRFKYTFPDGAEYTLNLAPLRRNYTRQLLSDAGFERVKTYGDFQDTYAESEPDYFIHVADKVAPTAETIVRGVGRLVDADVRDVAEEYYDSDDAHLFYQLIWGGEDIHIGIYDQTTDIKQASIETIDRMIDRLPALTADARVLDLGAGYGGSMRRVVERFHCHATCLNISEVQNDTNRRHNRLADMSDRIDVVHGTYESVPEDDGSYDVVWSQDAFLHSEQRRSAVQEAWRVLKPGGYLLFTDPCQADDVPEGVLKPVYDRLQLASLGSYRFYREAAALCGFQLIVQEDMTHHLRTHYSRVREELIACYDELKSKGASSQYLDRMIVGLLNWVEAADAGNLIWGIQIFRKPD